MDYTIEQSEAAEAFTEHKSLIVNAFAGTGKTTVLRLMAERDTRRGLYLAYNNEIARDSRGKFPRTVICKTAHALALSCLPDELKNKARPVNSLNLEQLGRFLNRQVALSPRETKELAPLISSSIHWFCVSDNPYPDLQHVHRALSDSHLSADPVKILAALPAVWDGMVTANGSLPLTFDAQLKLLQLSGRPLPFDYILADEAQDMYSAIQSIIRNSGAQQVWVGDPNQQIYEFNGAENAMSRLDDLDSHSLTMSFRFGEWLAELVQPLLIQLGESYVIRGNPGVVTRRATRTLPVRIARGNATLLPQLVKAINSKKKVHVLGGTDKLNALLNSAERVMRKRPVRVGFFAGLNSWHEARERASERGNSALRQVVELIDKHRLSEVRRCVELVSPEENDAHVVLSTVHQAKGREFPKVAILDDFRGKPEYLMTFGGKAQYAPSSEMLRLLYVALTRAENELFAPMTLARRYGIAAELESTESRAQESANETVEAPIEPWYVEPEPATEDWGYANDYSSVSPVAHVQTMRDPSPEVGGSLWDRWGLRLIVLVGVVANLAMLEYKGYVDFSVFVAVIGK